MNRAVGRFLVAALLTASASNYAEEAQETRSERKAGYEDRGTGLGSPNTPSRMLIEEDIRTEPLFRFPEIDESIDSWWDFNSDVNERHGLRIRLTL